MLKICFTLRSLFMNIRKFPIANTIPYDQNVAIYTS